MSRKKHSSEFKCLVVQYFLEMHRGYTLTARHFSLERSVVRSWVRRLSYIGSVNIKRLCDLTSCIVRLLISLIKH